MHRLLQKNIKIEWDDEVITNIALTGYSQNMEPDQSEEKLEVLLRMR